MAERDGRVKEILEEMGNGKLSRVGNSQRNEKWTNVQGWQKNVASYDENKIRF